MRLLVFIMLAAMVLALKNPAAIYCEELGYEYRLEGNKGYCFIQEDVRIEEWAFYSGSQGKEYGACNRSGFETVVVEKNQYCELPNGTMMHVDDFLDLDLQDLVIEKEGVCGDGSCAMDENHRDCPEDCMQSVKDMVCESYRDGKCDPDCMAQETPSFDPDCPQPERKEPEEPEPETDPEPKARKEEDYKGGISGLRIALITVGILLLAALIARIIYIKSKR